MPVTQEMIYSFDLVHTTDRRLPNPQEFLTPMTEFGGQLLLTTPFTWLEEFTPKEHG